MSKQIDWSQPLSDEERAWAEQFPGVHAGMLEANAAQYPVQAEETLEGEDVEEVPYDKWTVEELSNEARRRNSEENKALPVTGKKDALIKVLENDDEASGR
jgi:hypothetical protein